MLAAARAGDLPRMRSARRVPTCERCARRRHQSAPRMPMASCRRRRHLCDRPSIFIAPSVSASRRVRSGPGRPRATLANARGGSGSDVRVWRSALPPVCGAGGRFGSRVASSSTTSRCTMPHETPFTVSFGHVVPTFYKMCTLLLIFFVLLRREALLPPTLACIHAVTNSHIDRPTHKSQERVDVNRVLKPESESGSESR